MVELLRLQKVVLMYGVGRPIQRTARRPNAYLVLVMMLTTSILGPLLIQGFAPQLADEHSEDKQEA